MITGIIGKKVGMTQIFDPDGTVHPATVIKAGPCVVVQAKTAQTDGYEAVQLGFVEEKPAKANKPTLGHFKKAKPVLLEPIMRVEVVVPKDYMGDVMGDLASRRGRIQSQEDRGGTQIINARVPLSEMFGYATDLRSRTQGRATYSMHFDRYEQAPQNVSEEVVARIQGTK